MEIFVVIVVWLAIIASVAWSIYNHTSHSKTGENILREDAAICDVKTENVGGRNALSAAIRTTITFDDGFIYISHKSHSRMNGPLSGHISVDSTLVYEIELDAIAAHQEAYRKQNHI